MVIAVMLRKAGEARVAEEKAGARPRTPYRFALARRSCRAACSASCAYTARSREILRFAQDDGKGKLKFRVKSWRTVSVRCHDILYSFKGRLPGHPLHLG